MATDLDITEDRDISIDDTGDFTTVTGESNVRLQHLNAILRGYEKADTTLVDRDSAEDLRVAIVRELRGLPYSDTFTVTTEPDPPDSIRAQVESSALDAPVEEEVSV